jgi:hypothetical protein
MSDDTTDTDELAQLRAECRKLADQWENIAEKYTEGMPDYLRGKNVARQQSADELRKVLEQYD